MSMSRLIIVSNRLPFSIDKNEEQPVLRQSSGGLVSALVSYFEKTGISASKFNEHIWVGSVDFLHRIGKMYQINLKQVILQ